LNVHRCENLNLNNKLKALLSLDKGITVYVQVTTREVNGLG